MDGRVMTVWQAEHGSDARLREQKPDLGGG